MRTDGSGLVETVDPTADRSRRSLIQVVDGVIFDLDSFDVGEDFKKALVEATKFAASTQAASEAYEEAVDAYKYDMRQHFDAWSKVVFYESKGEYKKAINILVELSKKEFKSVQFKGRVYLKLADVLAIAGDRKQSLKAMLRYYETMEADAKASGAADELKRQRVQLMKQLNALGGS